MLAYFVDDSGSNETLLQIGECIIVNRPMRIRTVLGSCVAVSFWQPRPLLGGLFHALLPTAGQDVEQPCRYVDTSISDVLGRLQELGARAELLEVRLFGGAFAAAQRASGAGIVDVGTQNVETARRVLAQHGLRALDERVGGTQGRTLIFDTGSGEIQCRELRADGKPDRSR